MNTNTSIGIVVILAVLVVGGFFLLGSDGSENLPPETTDQTADTNIPSNGTPVIGGSETVGTEHPAETTTAPEPVTITYSTTGFSPNKVTIKQGQSVTFVNKSGSPMWVASDAHPSHTGYSDTTRQTHCPDTAGTAFDQCAPGDSYTFTFQKTGSWGYHNHMGSEDGGTVVVTP